VDVENEIDELKGLVTKNIEVTEDTNRIVRKMRRTSRLAFIFQIVWWLIVAGVTGAAYYYLVQPQMAKIEQLYGMTQAQSQSWNDQVTNFLKFFQAQQSQSHATSTPP